MTPLDKFHLIASVFALTLVGSFVAFFISLPLRYVGEAGQVAGRFLRVIAGSLLALWFVEVFGLIGWGVMAFIWSVN